MRNVILHGIASMSVALSGFAVASAEPVEDAQYIVDATLSDEYLGAMMGAMADLMAMSIAGEMAKSGVSLSDDASETIVALMLPPMIDGMKVGLRDGLVEVYVDTVSAESLAAYRAFLETQAGGELMAALPEITTVSAQVGERVGNELGMIAATQMIQSIQSGAFPPGTSQATRDELTAVFGP